MMGYMTEENGMTEQVPQRHLLRIEMRRTAAVRQDKKPVIPAKEAVHAGIVLPEGCMQAETEWKFVVFVPVLRFAGSAMEKDIPNNRAGGQKCPPVSICFAQKCRANFTGLTNSLDRRVNQM